MRKLAFCVHGHFYQPPRENPFTGKIPQESGAAPFENWNEKILAQCYRPNADEGNFGRISFDLGPTLASWMETFHPDVLAEIVRQEQEFYQAHGVGNGMAQSYNHSILPLISYEDKVTQIKWGIADFEARFGHLPEGLWAPETAVDLESLSVMAECGINYTILAPWQANVRRDLDLSIPYTVELPGNRSIAIFFYEDQLSMKVSFNPQATVNADRFVKNELMSLYPENSRRERLYVIASDGELYGHHQPLRDKFLTWLTTGALKDIELESVIPSVWLKKYPPQKTIRIRNNTSWSCHHGTKRWVGQCECGEHCDWKAPLYRAFMRIAELVDSEMQTALNRYHLGLLEFRNEYASILTGQESHEELLERTIGKKIASSEKEKLILFMNAQYERQRMFTSCGWFFGDFDRLEAQNNILYAARAVDLIERATGKEYRKNIGKYLAKVESWQSGLKASTVFNNAFKPK